MAQSGPSRVREPEYPWKILGRGQTWKLLRFDRGGTKPITI